jgi:hypothetical protein
MEKKGSLFFLDRIRNNTFFFILFLYQLLFIFQGVDFTDEGFYATFYQQIFHSPQSVQYNFMYWLSGIIGGAYIYLFPSFGLLGLRLGGVLATTLTIILSFNLLKKHLNNGHLKLGLLLATVLISNDPKALFYDNLSALFFVAIVVFLFNGLSENKLSKLFLCGIFLALNLFIKLTNLADIALGAVILYHAILSKANLKYVLKQVACFVGGIVITTIAILLIMKWIGHLSIFMSCISLVKQMGASGENTHGVVKLIKWFKYEYTHAIINAIYTLLIVIVGAAIINKIKNKYVKQIILYSFSLITLSVFIVLAFIKDSFAIPYLLLGIITGLSLIAAILIVISNNKNINIKTLAFSGAIMVLILPLGSDFGMYAAGRYALWLALPIAIGYYLNLSSYPLNMPFLKQTSIAKIISFFRVAEKQLPAICKWVVASFIIVFLFIAFTNTWNDTKDRTKMIYKVNSIFLQGVFTTQQKALLINELLFESAKYIKKDDYVLAYDEIPLFYAMTETKPFIYNSWPKLYDRAVFKQELEKDLKEKNILPVVIYQKIMTLSNKWPDFTDDNKKWDINQPRNLYIRNFLDSNHYKMVWENLAFRIYIPSYQSALPAIHNPLPGPAKH